MASGWAKAPPANRASFLRIQQSDPTVEPTWLYGPLEPHPDQPGVKVVPQHDWSALVRHTEQLLRRWGVVRNPRVGLAQRALATAKLALKAGDTNSACDRAAQAAEEMVSVGLKCKNITAENLRKQYQLAYPYLASTEETSVALLRTVQQARRAANLLGKVMPKGQAKKTVNQAESFVTALAHGISAEMRNTEHQRFEGEQIKTELKTGFAPAAKEWNRARPPGACSSPRLAAARIGGSSARSSLLRCGCARSSNSGSRKS